MTIKIGVLGASGRTGGLILQVLPEFSEFCLGAAIVAPHCSSIGTVALGEVKFSSDYESVVSKCDVWVDFSSPESSISLAHLCAQHKKPLVIATTGHSKSELDSILNAARSCPILLAPNTSIGVFALKEISIFASQILGESFDIEVSEIHHRLKKDAPSGTALYLAKALQDDRLTDLTYDRTARHESRRDNEIGVSSLRGGDVAGEHTVYFVGKGERLELTHRVWDRKVFARGALILASKIVEKGVGLHSLNREFFI